MKNITIYVCLLIIFLISCKSSPSKVKDSTSTSVILPENNTLKLSSIFKNYKLIQLSGIALTGIQKVEFLDSLLIVRGKSTESELHVFDANGEYIHSILKIGRGVNETLNIQNFIVDPKKKNIEILCDYGRKIIVYSLVQKSIINEINICPEIYSAQDIQKIDSIRYVLYKQCGFTDAPEYKINIYNAKKNIVENHFLEIDKKASEYISFSQYNNLFKINNDIFFYETFIDTIYKYNSEQLKVAWIFDKQQYTFPQTLLYKGYHSLNDFIHTCKNNKYIWAQINVFEYQNIFFSIFNYNDRLYLNITEKVTKKSTSYTQIFDDLITNEKLDLTLLIQIGNNDQFCYFYIEPFELMDIIDKKKQYNSFEKYKNDFSQNCKFIESLDMNSNSILILFEK